MTFSRHSNKLTVLDKPYANRCNSHTSVFLLMESIFVSPAEPAERSSRITISYPQLRSLGYLRPATPADLPEKQGEFCVRQIVEGDTGWGVMESWPVFPGMDLIWFDMSTDCDLTLPADPEHRLEILCCYEGRCEIQGGHRRYCYMEEGDLAVCSASPDIGLTGFPSGRFRGICIRINMNPETRDLPGILRNFSIHLPDLYRAAGRSGILPMTDCTAAKHIFAELREQHHQFRPDFLKLKIIELLLVLSVPENAESDLSFPTLTGYQVSTVKEIRNFMVEHFDEHYTTMDLSARFHFSATSLKQWFRIIYGSSMYAYLKHCRMEIARALLLRTDYSVLQVALYVGYENRQKFSSAFRDEVGMTPKQYRLSQTDLSQIRPAN